MNVYGIEKKLRSEHQSLLKRMTSSYTTDWHSSVVLMPAKIIVAVKIAKKLTKYGIS